MLEIRPHVAADYPDIHTPAARAALEALAGLDDDRRELMDARIRRRAERLREGRSPTFLDPDFMIPRTSIRVRDARAGAFDGAEIPADLERQWIQGTGPAAKPRSPVET